MAPLRVLICGGGITGPALGFWLSKTDSEITIVERAPDLRASGQQIDLRAQAVTVAKRMGIEQAIRAKVVDEAGVQFIDRNWKVKAYFEANKTGKGKQSFTSEFEIMRGDLCRILYDVTRDKVKYVFRKYVEKFEQPGKTVHVTFSDGTQGEFDLVVGADGQSSRTRRQILAPGAPDPFKSLGLYMCYFTVPRMKWTTKKATVVHFPEYRVLFTRTSHPETMQVYMASMSGSRDLETALRSGDVRQQKQLWALIYRDAGWECPEILDAMLHSPLADDFYFQHIGQVRMDGAWSRGRVVLAGDAACTASPLTGKGTTLGLVSAYVLAGEIARRMPGGAGGAGGGSGSAREMDVEAAVGDYERRFRPFAEKCQWLAPGIPGLVYPKSDWGIYILHSVLGWTTTLRLDKLMSMTMSDDVAGWDLPDYEELKDKTDGSV